MGSELGDDFKEWTKAKKSKKRSNLENSTRMLIKEGVKFHSKNDGVHLIVESPFYGLIDYWPSTGRFIVRKSNRNGRGVRNLIKQCKQED